MDTEDEKWRRAKKTANQLLFELLDLEGVPVEFNLHGYICKFGSDIEDFLKRVE